MDKIDAELAVAKVTAKAAKEPITARIGELKAQVTTKKEHRLVDCEESKDFKRNMVEVVRIDTGEVVDSRPMTPDERQEELDVDPPPAPDVPER